MKQTIEEAAKEYVYGQCAIPGNTKSYDAFMHIAFITGAKSQSAKDFHTQGMYSEEEVLNIAGQVFAFTTLNDGKDPYFLFKAWFEEYKKKKNEST
jgi:hypothetical protein